MSSLKLQLSCRTVLRVVSGSTVLAMSLMGSAVHAQLLSDQGGLLQGISSQRPPQQPQTQVQPQPTSTIIAPWAQAQPAQAVPTNPIESGGSSNGSSATLAVYEGFAPDPFVRVVNAGGPVAAQQLSPSCRGNFSAEPQQLLNVSVPLGFLRLMARSQTAVSLAVRTPTGMVFCVGGATQMDAAMDLRSLTVGTYQVYVGSPGALSAALLVVSKNPTLAMTHFAVPVLAPTVANAPATAVSGAAVAGAVSVPTGWVSVDGDAQNSATAMRPTATTTPMPRSSVAPLSVSAGTASTQTQRGSVTGQTPMRRLSRRCIGFAEQTATASFVVGPGVAWVRTAVHADQDSTLLLRAPNGRVMCADDTYGVHPGIDLTTVAPGRWEVFVGTYAPNTTVRYELTVSTDRQFTPQSD
jgi:hypothetical protein